MSDSIVTIPLFPINISILPDELVPLHIFEERYKKMVSQTLKDNTQFGIIYRQDKKIKNIGCSVLIDRVYKKYRDGKYDILVKGRQRFKIISLFKEDDLYVAEVKFLNELYNDIEKDFFSKVLDKYLRLLLIFNIDHDIQNEMNKKTSFDFIRNILIPNNIKQEFLELENESKRMYYIDNFLDSLISKSKDKKNKLFKGKIPN